MANPASLTAPVFTKETARANQLKSAAKRKGKHVKAREAALKSDGPLSRGEWESLYVLPTFGDAWARAYRKAYRELEAQYATGQESAQYKVLVRRAATLSTLVDRMTAEKAPEDLIDKTDGRLLAYIKQLQLYNEAEQKSITVRDEAQSAILEVVVALAESTVSDLRQREAFLVALMRQLVGEDAARSVERVMSASEDADIVDAEVVSSVVESP